MSVVVLKNLDSTQSKFGFRDLLNSDQETFPKNSEIQVFTKGAPETILGLCTPESIPICTREEIAKLSRQGLRVIAIAAKKVSPENFIKLSASEYAESSLTFAGLVCFENPLKTNTKQTIRILDSCGIGTVMITGDNLLTALSVSLSCDIVSSKRHNLYMLSFDKGSETLSCELIQEKVEDSEDQVKPINFEKFDEAILADDYEKVCPAQSVNKLNYTNRVDQKSFTQDKSKKQAFELIDPEEALHEEQQPLTTKNDNIQPQISEVDDLLKRDKSAVLGMEGDTFDYLCKSLTHRLILRTKVFARSNPEQKSRIVKYFQRVLAKSNSSNLIGFCGDGANDCSALKSANVGLSLTQTEASIAAPFSTVIKDISSVLELIKEGKCSLSVAVENFMFISFTALGQYFGILILYYFFTDFSEGHYYYMDLGFSFVCILLASKTPPSDSLNHRYPPGDLLNLPVMLRLLGSVFFLLVYLILACFFLSKQEFYISVQDSLKEDGFGSYNFMLLPNNLVFYVVAWGYLASVFVCFHGAPFKKRVYSNIGLMVFVGVHALFLGLFYFWNDLLVLSGSKWSTWVYYLLFVMNGFIRIMSIGSEYKVFCTVLGVSTFLFMLVVDKFLISWVIKCHYRRKDWAIVKRKREIANRRS